MIRNLIFDFGKVLVDFDFEAFFNRLIPDEKQRWTLRLSDGRGYKPEP